MDCIYCKEDKPLSSYKKREHVIPQAFGKFIPDNLVLKNCVCDECNQFFGDRIELFLGRDSFESIERLRHGMKPKWPLKNRRRVKSKVRSGPWKGVIVKDRSLSETGHIGIEKAVQAGFYHTERNEYDFFEPKDIPTGKELVERGYAVNNDQIRLIAEDGEELDKLIGKLKEQGINVNSKTDFINQDSLGELVPVETDITLDRTIMRGFCKIAFNYMAFVAGCSFVLEPDFDDVRRFIRFDEGNSDNFLGVNLPPILYDDQILDKIGAKVTDGHLLIVGWRGKKVVSKLSLFNTLTFGVNLCHNFNGIWRPIESGHHFDVKTKGINKLVTLSKSLMP